jgi:diguanylate cyclase (GGDEF)-like protein/PAS domain S-box-containing protein
MPHTESMPSDGASRPSVERRALESWGEIERALRISELVFEHSSEGIVVMDTELRVLRVNPAFSAITGYAADEVIGRSCSMLRAKHRQHPNVEDLLHTLRTQGSWAGEVHGGRKDGTDFPAWLSFYALRERGETTHFVAQFSDISERKEHERRLLHVARHDPLTGLANRVMLEEQGRAAIARAGRSGSRVAVLFIDLDRFKLVNDSLGHQAGDELLVEVSRRLLATVRATDTVARLGGDEFVIVGECLESQSDAGHLARRVHHALGKPVTVRGRSFHVSPSIGVSVFPDDGDDLEALRKHADTAMYQVKSAGRDGWLFFTPAMNAAVQERLLLERDLRLAIERDELVLHFQPQYCHRTHSVAGFEALVRWNHRTRGLLAPSQFIPLAEETGVIFALGDWVLRAACAQALAWEHSGLGRHRVSVNLSTRQFRQKNLADLVERALAESGLSPDRLELELTESALMDNVDEAAAVLRRLKTQGVRIAIDDFGTGYSSLAYLRALPIDRIKIDRSFVQDVTAGDGGAVIASAIISLAQSLGLGIIAEGVETEDQRAFLRSRGCHDVQGFLVGHPAPASEIDRALLLRA